jgi:DNA-binding transcriptional LysR family regulator
LTPVSAKHRYAIGANDYFECLVLPGLMKELQERAPGVDVYIGQPDISGLDGKLESGDIDIALGFEAVMQCPRICTACPYFKTEWRVWCDETTRMSAMSLPSRNSWI